MFNIRVYGILINEKQEVLVSDEHRHGIAFTKFPGGGMEFGEGFKTTLAREFKEELQIEVEVGELVYFNDFLQVSAFNPQQQLFSFYYFVHFNDWRSIETNKHTIPLTEDGEKHRWISLSEISAAKFNFPIDKIVAEKLKESF
jgi:8-oxo-dGTP diphosphatase